MKRLHKTVCSVLAAATVLAAGAFADDFGFDFSDSGDSGFDFGDGGDASSGGASSSPALTFTGDASVDGRLYVDQRDGDGDRYSLKDFPTAAFPSFKLGMEYAGAYTDFSGKLKFDKFSLGDYKQDILEEFTARVYINSNWQLEAGKMKVVWGKGDKLHVLDNFNANDYTDYIIPDYIDRRIAEPMFRAVYTTNGGIKFEGIYTPVMATDRLASSGAWKPAQVGALESSVKAIATTNVATAFTNYTTLTATVSTLSALGAQAETTPGTATTTYTAALTQAGFTSLEEAKAALQAAGQTYLLALNSATSLNASELYPDTFAFKYGQAGIRSTFTIGQVDLGASYYYGHYKQPSVNQVQLANFIADYMANGGSSNLDSGINYDRLQVFGLEAATVLWRFNTRAELAYYLTKDTDGDDPWVHNNSLQWIFGFDLDLPIHNVNLNVQNQGRLTLHHDKLGGANGVFEKADVDYNGGHATNNKIVVAITDSWDHEKTKLDLKGIWGIERSDLIIMPKISRNLFDGFDVSLSGMFIWCKDSDSEFDGWEHNSFVSLGARYQF